MRRSQINTIIDNAISTLHDCNFPLPPWAYWTKLDWINNWEQSGRETSEICTHGLGWNITDFGSGEFDKVGLLIFVARNGHLHHNQPSTTKTYAEKIFFVEPGQVTPWHFHWCKTEDLINRSGGKLEVELAWAAKDERSLSDRAVSVQVDGITKTLPAGGKIILQPGESVTFPPNLCHKFYGSPSSKKVLAGEISNLNDDATDNCFLGLEVGRSPIIEDVAAKYLLFSEYSRLCN